MPAYYNEIDPFAAAWLRELIKAGLIAPGDVDERSIEDVTPTDLAPYEQCHFFAGIGTWSYALRQAGWPDDRPVWTGSCPCQPFSAAGKGKGFTDERHLWPYWYWLVQQSRPSVIFGEQVASRNGLSWLDVVSTDLENAGYAVGALDLCAAGVGAPHRRQRLYFVADAQCGTTERCRYELGCSPEILQGKAQQRKRVWIDIRNGIPTGGVAHTELYGSSAVWEFRGTKDQGRMQQLEGHCATNGFWQDAEWLSCRDGKYRATQPGIAPLVNGTLARVGRLRGYGNGIVAPLATEFIKAYMDLVYMPTS